MVYSRKGYCEYLAIVSRPRVAGGIVKVFHYTGYVGYIHGIAVFIQFTAYGIAPRIEEVRPCARFKLKAQVRVILGIASRLKAYADPAYFLVLIQHLLYGLSVLVAP